MTEAVVVFGMVLVTALLLIFAVRAVQGNDTSDEYPDDRDE